MYEIDLDGAVIVVTGAALIGAWGISSAQAVADALALEVGMTSIACADPIITVRRIL